MAQFLASIFGTEQDKVNCSFYYKIGACRHGERCSRKHVKPSYSQTILMQNMYQNPAHQAGNKMNAEQLQNHFDAFYEDIWCEMCKYGQIEELVVCDNNNDHLIGNVYARFKYEDEAAKARDDLNNRWYAGRPVHCELSPVTDFREACCRLNSGEGCVRGGFCNFIHRKDPSPAMEYDLEMSTRKHLKMLGIQTKPESRSPTPDPPAKRANVNNTGPQLHDPAKTFVTPTRQFSGHSYDLLERSRRSHRHPGRDSNYVDSDRRRARQNAPPEHRLICGLEGEFDELAVEPRIPTQQFGRISLNSPGHDGRSQRQPNQECRRRSHSPEKSSAGKDTRRSRSPRW